MDRRQVAIGVALVTLGLVFLIGEMHLLPEWNLRRNWPIVPLVFGLMKLVWPSPSGSRASGLPFIAVGIVFLLHNYQVRSVMDLWPVFIIALGLSMFFKSAGERSAARKEGSR